LLFAGGAWWSWRQVQAEARDRLERTVATLAEHALRALETQDALLAAAQRAAQGMSWADIQASAELASFLRDLDDTTSAAGEIGMIDPQGRLVQITSAPFPPPLVDLSERDYVRVQTDPATAAPYLGETIAAQIGGLRIIPYSRPRLGPDGQPDGGTLWATLRAEVLGAYYLTVLQHPRDLVMLARQDGALLLTYPAAPEGAAVSPRFLQPLGMQTAGEAAARAQRGGALFHDRSPTDGEERLYVVRQLPRFPMIVSYGQHPAGPRKAWVRQITALGLIASAASTLLLTLIWITSHRLRRQAETQRAVEARLRQSERLSAFGQVTAGVAHDFRNIAQSVQGGARLIQTALGKGDTERALAVAALLEDAGLRGSALTERMLLAVRVDRDGDPSTATLELDRALAETTALLAVMLGERWTLRITAAPQGLPARVQAKATEFEATLLNLVANARDAMPDGGEIELALTCEKVMGSNEGLPPGPYVRIVVRDDGVGMDAATLARVGEAFFTTKPAGKGTGLGLSGAAAFAREAGGALKVESPGPGQGTTVTLWLPATS
jgi:two-component system NtrC family sensor kinase